MSSGVSQLIISLGIVFLIKSVFSEKITAKEYALLPKLYDLEKSDACFPDKLFCRVYIKLTPLNETHPSKVWKVIQKTKLNKFNFDYDSLRYGMCIDESILKNENKYLPPKYEKDFKEMGLSSSIDTLFCTSTSVELKRKDYVTTSILISYLMFIFYATWKSKQRNQKMNTNKTTSGKVLSIFSLETTIKSLSTTQNNSRDFVKLKAIQGIRTLNMVLVMVGHVTICFYGLYVDNPHFFEDIYNNPGLRLLCNILIFVVQTNFLISAWLLASKLYDLQQSNGKLLFKDICLIGLHRCLRLWPTVIFIYLIHNSFNLYLIPLPYKHLVELEIQKCENNNWWPTLLFIQNLFPETMCIQVAWYISVDVQLYMLSLIIFYVSFKLNYPPYKVIGFLTLTGLAIHLWLLTQFNTKGIFLFSLKVRLEQMFKFSEDGVTYVSTLCSFGTYMIGLLFGGIYFYSKNNSFTISKTTTTVWLLIFFVFPVSVFCMTVLDNKWIQIFVSVFSKPIYSVGIATGILGMSFGIGGSIKRLYESKHLEKLATFNFSTYMSHVLYFMLVIYRHKRPFDINFQYAFTEVAINIILGFLCGLVVYILVEQPFLQLQKMFIPEVRKDKPTKDVKSTE